MKKIIPFPNPLDTPAKRSENIAMKISNSSHALFLALAGSLMLISCAPVLDRSYMRVGDRAASFAALRGDPDQYKGRLFILGGVIVGTRLTEAGTQIEAMHVPVDSTGYFQESGRSEGRYLAIVPKDEKMLDPVVYRKEREFTLAGEFLEIRKGKIDEMEYLYPTFRIRQIYLWPEEIYYSYPPYYYDPWLHPYPYYYRHPWWRYPHYYRPTRVQPAFTHRASPIPAPQPEQAL